MLRSTKSLLTQVNATTSRQFSTGNPTQASKQFLVVLRDYKDPEALQRRLNVREKHLEGALSANKRGIVNLGGAIFDNHESRKMEGSVLVVSAESKEEVENLILSDPYYDGKVWEKWDILPVNLAIGKIV